MHFQGSQDDRFNVPQPRVASQRQTPATVRDGASAFELLTRPASTSLSSTKHRLTMFTMLGPIASPSFPLSEPATSTSPKANQTALSRRSCCSAARDRVPTADTVAFLRDVAVESGGCLLGAASRRTPHNVPADPRPCSLGCHDSNLVRRCEMRRAGTGTYYYYVRYVPTYCTMYRHEPRYACRRGWQQALQKCQCDDLIVIITAPKPWKQPAANLKPTLGRLSMDSSRVGAVFLQAKAS